TPEQKLILYGDTTKKNTADQQKAIWDKFPDNKIYAANYILAYKGWSYDGRNRDLILSEINRAVRVDPDNAFYNYLAAGIILKDACNEVAVPPANSKANQQYQYRIEIKDRALLEKAMREYLAGINKPYCRSYTSELLKQRLQILGEDSSLTGQLERISIAASVLLPHLNHYRTIARCMPEYAGILIKEGKTQEAAQYLKTWPRLIRDVNSDDGYLITLLVAGAIARIDAEKLPPLYDKLGMADAAKATASEAESLYKPVREWKEKSKRTNYAVCSNHGSILTNICLPGLGQELTSKELAPARYAEYVFFQKITLALINLALIAGMIVAIGAALYWRFRNGSSLLLLAPPLMTVVKILGLGAVLPCIAYFIISQFEPLSGYDLGLRLNSGRFVAQMALLLALVPVLVLTLTRRYVTARCGELGVATPPASGIIQKITIITGLTLLCVEAFTPLGLSAPKEIFTGRDGIYNYHFAVFCMTHIILVAAIAILAGVFLFQLVNKVIALFNGGKYSIYHGAAARILLLIFALAVLVLTCVFRPILDWREAAFIREDQIIFGSAESFTKIEGEVVKELKDAINQAMAKIQK
ncbi:MAG: hypothetical protein ACYC4Q_12470, partial [Victivallaceae bacterium]